MGNLVLIKEKYQVTIPASLRKKVDLHPGDYLEASLCRGGILLRPKRVEDISEKRSSILDFFHESRPSTRSREEIDAALEVERSSWD